MKRILISILISFNLLITSSAFAMDSKMRVVSTMAGYGVVGGALLGTASLAFGTTGRAIAKGASLGLYAGLLFGAYVITSYEMKKRGYGEPKDNYYPESQGPYENSDSMITIPNIESYALVSNEIKKDPKKDPLVSLNVLTIQF